MFLIRKTIDRLRLTRTRATTQGLMFVTSRVRDPRKTPDELYNRFYDEEHLGLVLAGGQTKLALRYKNVSTKAAVPYIALYPINDVSFFGSPGNLKLIEDVKKSEILGCDNVSELIDFELRSYEKIHTFEGYGRARRKDASEQPARTLIVVTIDPAEGCEKEIDAWYRKQHLEMLNMCKGFRRCTRYMRVDGACPRYLALAEYDSSPRNLPRDQIKQVYATEWNGMISARTKSYDLNVFALIQAQGATNLQL
ncbi:hypothetical protein O1611_g1773 [Lasiodiplodia mahajangana]|uniref:Uncharacterized protein n=1 Tax=Lasiodiplodia mahajangana TaxID=1108764 RepID=A0ACC2JWK0_9PEZI|nr:hypothetical protein O1611_g1773 [Lasiodiplodia mahajangana]